MNKKLIVALLCLLTINNNSFAMLAKASNWINQRFGTQAAIKAQAATSQAKQAAQRPFTTNVEQPAEQVATKSTISRTGLFAIPLFATIAGYFTARQIYAPQTSPIEARKEAFIKQRKFAESTPATMLYNVGLGQNPTDRLKVTKEAEELFNAQRLAFGATVGKPIQERFVEINKEQEDALTKLYSAQRTNDKEQAQAAQKKLDILALTFTDLVPDAHTISSDNELLQSRAVTLNRHYAQAREKYDNAKTIQDKNSANAELKKIGKEKAEIYAQAGTLFSGFASWLRGAVAETDESTRQR